MHDSLIAHPRAVAILTALLATGWTSGGAVAQTKPPSPVATTAPPAVESEASDAWELRVGIPIWLAGLDGTLTVGGSELEPSEDPSDTDLFSSHLDFAFALHAEAEKNRFGLILDTMYVDVSATANTDASAQGEGSVRGFIGELDGFYILTAPEPGVSGWGTLRADVLGGMRLTGLELGVDAPGVTASTSHTFIDPLVGARAELGLTDWLGYKLRGDIGGLLSTDTTSSLVWNVDTAFAFHVSQSFQLDLGYRWLYYDFSYGSGSSESGLDLTLLGPYLGVQFAFTF